MSTMLHRACAAVQVRWPAVLQPKGLQIKQRSTVCPHNTRHTPAAKQPIMPCCIQRLGVQHGAGDLAEQCAHALSRQRVRQPASPGSAFLIIHLSWQGSLPLGGS